MDDDGIAVAHQLLGFARDGALGIDGQHLVFFEGPGGKTIGLIAIARRRRCRRTLCGPRPSC